MSNQQVSTWTLLCILELGGNRRATSQASETSPTRASKPSTVILMETVSQWTTATCDQKEMTKFSPGVRERARLPIQKHQTGENIITINLRPLKLACLLHSTLPLLSDNGLSDSSVTTTTWWRQITLITPSVLKSFYFWSWQLFK